MPKAIFLHLSDFHFRGETDTDCQFLFNQFIQDLRAWQARKGQSINAIIITGDIAYSGQPNEYKLALQRINEILEVTGVKKDNVFIVPGNHDVNRSDISKPEEDTTRYILEGNNKVDEYFRKYKDYKMFLEKFSTFQQFIKDFGTPNTWWESNGTEPADGIKPWYSVRKPIPENDGTFFNFIGLTTSLFIGKGENLYGKIRISARQLQECINTVKGDEFVIVLGHHPIDWFFPEEQNLFQALVGQRRAIYFHGHLHKYQVQQRSYFSRKLNTIGAGSVYSSSTNPNRYHIFKLDLDANTLVMWPRKWYSDDVMQWHQDNDWQNLDHDQSYSVPLPWMPKIPEKFVFDHPDNMNPYNLNGRQLSFFDFPDMLHLTQDESGKVKVKIVVGSGRFTEADHVSYGTDCLGIPEITTLLERDPNVTVSSCLDIDVYSDKEALKDQNLILLGSGKVNYVTMRLLEHYGDRVGFKFNHPEYSTLSSSSSGKTYVDGDQNDWGLGTLALLRNPWASDAHKRRVAILIAGFHPLGSMAANNLLRTFIANPSSRENNKRDNTIPLKIVRGRKIDFNDYVKSIPDIIETPLKNKTYIGNLNGEPEILE